MTDAPLSRTRGWVLALVATSTMVVSYVDRQTLAVLAPTVTRALHIDEVHYGWLISSFAVAYLIGAPLAGRLMDLVGARRGLLVAMLTWTVIAALHAIAPTFAMLLLLRVALGLAESPSFPGAAQTIHRALQPRDRARGVGVLFCGGSIGAAVAPMLALALSRHFGFRAAFLGTAAAGLLWVPAWLAVAWTKKARAIDIVTETAPRTPWLALASSPIVVRAVLLVIASAPMLFFLLAWHAKLLVRTYGVDEHAVGPYLVFPPLFYDIGAIAFGDLASRLGRAKPLVIIAALFGCTIACIPLAHTPAVATAIAALAMMGGGALYSLLTYDVFTRVPRGAVAAAGGICAASQSIAQIIAGPLIGLSVQRTGSYTLALLTLGAWLVPGTIAWLALGPAAAKATTPTRET